MDRPALLQAIDHGFLMRDNVRDRGGDPLEIPACPDGAAAPAGR